MYELQWVQRNADGIIVSGARLSLFRDRLEGRAGYKWMLLLQFDAACRTKDTDRDGDLKLKTIAVGARGHKFPTGYPINSLPVTSRPMVMI